MYHRTYDLDYERKKPHIVDDGNRNSSNVPVGQGVGEIPERISNYDRKSEAEVRGHRLGLYKDDKTVAPFPAASAPPPPSIGVHKNIDPSLTSSTADIVKDGMNSLPSQLTSINLLVDYRKNTHHFLGIRFIFECGIKLEVQPTTMATAAVLYHRFFTMADEKIYDIYLIGAACLCIAGKIEYESVKIRDVVNVAYNTIHRNSEPLTLKDYSVYKNALAQVELHLMRMFEFKVNDIVHPHKYLIHYLYSLQSWVGTKKWSEYLFPRTSWSLLQDFHYSPSVLKYPPQAIALAALRIGLMSHGTNFPLTSFQGPNSMEKIFYENVDFDMQEEIMEKLLKVYDSEEDVMSIVTYVKPQLVKELKETDSSNI